MKSDLLAEVSVVCVKALAAAAAAVWAHLHNVAPMTGAFLALLVFDMILGIVLAHKRGEHVSVVKLVKGPTILMLCTAIMFLAASVIDRSLGIEVVLYAVSCYVLLATFYTVAKKYREITGHNVIEAVLQVFKKRP